MHHPLRKSFTGITYQQIQYGNLLFLPTMCYWKKLACLFTCLFITCMVIAQDIAKTTQLPTTEESSKANTSQKDSSKSPAKRLPKDTSLKPTWKPPRPKPQKDSLGKMLGIIKKDTAHVSTDTLLNQDSLLVAQRKLDSLKSDSTAKANAAKLLLTKKNDTSTYAAVFYCEYLPIHLPAKPLLEKERNATSNEELFYLLTGAVFLIAITKLIFPKYFSNMFLLFFQTSHRQKQAIENLANNKISSLLFNLAFVLSFAIYLTLLLGYNGLVRYSFWNLLPYSLAIIACIYLIKFVFLYFVGWAFNEEKAVSSYSFVVFISNKLLGIILLPFIFLVAFNSGAAISVYFTITYYLFGAALLYRFFIAVSSLRTQLKLSVLHFTLYLFSIEILPLMLLYKALFQLIMHGI